MPTRQAPPHRTEITPGHPAVAPLSDGREADSWPLPRDAAADPGVPWGRRRAPQVPAGIGRLVAPVRGERLASIDGGTSGWDWRRRWRTSPAPPAAATRVAAGSGPRLRRTPPAGGAGRERRCGSSQFACPGPVGGPDGDPDVVGARPAGGGALDRDAAAQAPHPSPLSTPISWGGDPLAFVGSRSSADIGQRLPEPPHSGVPGVGEPRGRGQKQRLDRRAPLPRVLVRGADAGSRRSGGCPPGDRLLFPATTSGWGAVITTALRPRSSAGGRMPAAL